MADGGIDYNCLATKRRGVVNYYAQYGWDTTTLAGLQAIFTNWWTLDRAKANDPSAQYADLGTYAATLGCLAQAPIPAGQPGPTGTVSGTGTAPSAPPTGTSQPFSFTSMFQRWFSADQAPATAAAAIGIILVWKMLNRD